MIKSFFSSSVPFFLAAAGGDAYGLPAGTFGTALFVMAFFLLIANQIWTLADKWRKSVRNPEPDTSPITAACGQYRREIGRTLDQLRVEDQRQDRLNKEHFARLEHMVESLRHEVSETNKGTADCFKDILRAVSRLEGKVQ